MQSNDKRTEAQPILVPAQGEHDRRAWALVRHLAAKIESDPTNNAVGAEATTLAGVSLLAGMLRRHERLLDATSERPCNGCGGSGYVAKLKPGGGPGYKTFANAYGAEWRPYIADVHDERDYQVKECRSCGPRGVPS